MYIVVTIRSKAHPRKQLFFTPVSKFTAKPSAPSANIDRIRSCLEQYTASKSKITSKAASMEDLTPTKRIRREKTVQEISVVRTPGSLVRSGSVEQRAGARVARFMLLSAWRRRRYEIRYMRKTLEFQVSCSERLRLQVSALKSLLESDTNKVRFAMRELERLKKMLREKEMEKAVLEKEKHALEQDVSAAEDRASEMSIGWRNSRNEVETTRAAVRTLELVLNKEKEKEVNEQAVHQMVYKLEGELSQQKIIVRSCQAQAATLRRRLDERGELLLQTEERLSAETEARSHCLSECESLRALGVRRSAEIRARVEHAASLQRELELVREQLHAWPAPLTRMLCAARSWIRRPMSLSETVMWSLMPTRHGC